MDSEDDDDEDEDRVVDRPWITALIVVIGFLVGLLISVLLLFDKPAKSEERLSEIDIRDAAYCSLYSREAARIDLTHATEPTSTAGIRALALRHYRECISILPTLLPLPEAYRELDAWIADMRKIAVADVGTVPAGDAPAGGWEEACAAEYRTWDAATGTVVRRGSPDRVRCPLVKEGDQWVIPD